MTNLLLLALQRFGMEMYHRRDDEGVKVSHIKQSTFRIVFLLVVVVLHFIRSVFADHHLNPDDSRSPPAPRCIITSKLSNALQIADSYPLACIPTYTLSQVSSRGPLHRCVPFPASACLIYALPGASPAREEAETPSARQRCDHLAAAAPFLRFCTLRRCDFTAGPSPSNVDDTFFEFFQSIEALASIAAPVVAHRPPHSEACGGGRHHGRRAKEDACWAFARASPPS